MLYDGWLLRFAYGYTKRANSVNPLYGHSQAVQPKIERCVQIYRDKNLPPVFRLTPLAQPNDLDDTLARLGFTHQSLTSAQLLDITALAPTQVAMFRYWSALSPEWEAHFTSLNSLSNGKQAAHRAILGNITPQTCFAVLYQQNRAVACGLGVLENQYVGLFDLVTDVERRRQGFGQALITGILSWAQQNGATRAYLQVEVSNTPALNLYRRLGFVEVYQYWYRVLTASKSR
jgi:ribosomal protein S18 acetylase RimI-like enzyme